MRDTPKKVREPLLPPSLRALPTCDLYLFLKKVPWWLLLYGHRWAIRCLSDRTFYLEETDHVWLLAFAAS